MRLDTERSKKFYQRLVKLRFPCADFLLHRWREVHKCKMTLVIEVILVTLIDEGRQIIAGRSPIGGALTRVAGGYWAGCAGDRGPAINAQLNGPSGVAVDGAGSLYIADAGNKRIRKVS